MCYTCPKGRFANSTGSPTCEACPVGHYCPATGSTGYLSCPEGTSSFAGNSSCGKLWQLAENRNCESSQCHRDPSGATSLCLCPHQSCPFHALTLPGLQLTTPHGHSGCREGGVIPAGSSCFSATGADECQRYRSGIRCRYRYHDMVWSCPETRCELQSSPAGRQPHWSTSGCRELFTDAWRLTNVLFITFAAALIIIAVLVRILRCGHTLNMHRYKLDIAPTRPGPVVCRGLGSTGTPTRILSRQRGRYGNRTKTRTEKLDLNGQESGISEQCES